MGSASAAFFATTTDGRVRFVGESSALTGYVVVDDVEGGGGGGHAGGSANAGAGRNRSNPPVDVTVVVAEEEKGDGERDGSMSRTATVVVVDATTTTTTTTTAATAADGRDERDERDERDDGDDDETPSSTMTWGNHTVKATVSLRKNGSYGSLPRPASIGSLVTLAAGECGGGGNGGTTTTLFPGQGVMLARDVSSARREGCVVVARAHHRGKIGPVIKKKRSARGREYRFAFAEEKDAARAIGELCAGCGIEESQRGGQRRRLFVVVNPKSGKGEGIKIWESKAAWVLASAGFDFDAYVTRAAGEATTLARERFDASRYDGIVAVGGDGTVAEIFQGLNEREDAKETLGKVAIGIVAAGSGNALCKSIQQDADEPCDPVSCALTIARARTRALDSSVVRFLDSKTGEWSNSKQAHSLLSTSWGFFSDVDIESEKFRFLGGARFTLQAIVRIISRRTYSCEILYETTEEGEDHNAHFSQGSRGEPVPGRPGWRKIHGDILGLWALNVPWGTECTMAAPFAKFNDGSIDLVVVRPTGRKNMVKLLLAFDAGDHVHNRAVSYLKAKSFEVYPGKCSSTRSGGFIAVDGEVSAQRHDSKSSQAPYGPFRCDVRFAGCRVFAPAPPSAA